MTHSRGPKSAESPTPTPGILLYLCSYRHTLSLQTHDLSHTGPSAGSAFSWFITVSFY